MLVWDWNNIEILAHFHGTGSVWMQRSSLFSPLKIVSFQPSSIFIQHIFFLYIYISFSLVGCSLTLPTITHLPLRTVYIYSDKKAARTLLVLLPFDFNRLGLVMLVREIYGASPREGFSSSSLSFLCLVGLSYWLNSGSFTSFGDDVTVGGCDWLKGLLTPALLGSIDLLFLSERGLACPP